MTNGDPGKQRLRQLAAQEQTAEQQQTVPQHTALTFQSVEDLLRYDAAHTPPPPTLAARLQTAIAQEPRRSWWHRLWSRLRPE